MDDAEGTNWTQRTKPLSQPQGRPSEYYQVYLSDKKAGFEFGEHALSGQLLFIFERVPDLRLAGDLEAMGFSWMGDERTFTTDADDKTRQKAFKRAKEYLDSTKGQSL